MSNELRTAAPDLKGFLMKNMNVIQSVAARVIVPERMIRLVCVAATRQPDLAECTPISILRAMTSAAEFGLEVCSGANEAYLVPFNVKVKRNGVEVWEKQAQFVPGYQGLVKKAVESGKIRNIEARVVYAKDTFDYEFGIQPTLKHRPHLGSDRGDIVAVYAVAFLNDGSCQFEVMAKDEVDAIKSRGKQKKFSPWDSDYSEMARKTVVRRLYKYIPKSKAMADLLEIQAKSEIGAFEFDGEVQRPGDSTLPGSHPALIVNTDGEKEAIWTDEQRQACHDLHHALIDALVENGVEPEEAKKRVEYIALEIGDREVTYETWLNRYNGLYTRCISETDEATA